MYNLKTIIKSKLPIMKHQHGIHSSALMPQYLKRFLGKSENPKRELAMNLSFISTWPPPFRLISSQLCRAHLQPHLEATAAKWTPLRQRPRYQTSIIFMDYVRLSIWRHRTNLYTPEVWVTVQMVAKINFAMCKFMNTLSAHIEWALHWCESLAKCSIMCEWASWKGNINAF